MSDTPVCVVCKRRKAFFARGKACRPCMILTQQEGTRAQYGLPEPVNHLKEQDTFVRNWNRWCDEGKSVADMAAELGWAKQSVKNRAQKLRMQGIKLKTPRGKRIEAQPPVDRTKLATKANDHGGGKWGIASCNCEPCLTRRRKSRALWGLLNPEKLQSYRTKYEQKRRQKQADKPS